MSSGYLLFVYILFIILVYFLVVNKRKSPLEKMNFFHYNNMFLLFIIIELPYLFTVYMDHSVIPASVLNNVGLNFDNVYNMHILNNMIYIFFVLVTMNIVNPKPKILNFFIITKYSSKQYFILHIVTLVISIIAFNFFLSSVGGLYFLLQNMDSRSTLTSGTGYIQALFSLSAFLSLGFLILSYKNNTKLSIRKKIYLFLIILFVFILLASTGGRKNSIILILYVATLWHFNMKPIKVFTFTNLIVFLMLILFISVMPLLRSHGASEFYIQHPSLLLSDAITDSVMFFKRFSDIDRSLFIYNHFNTSNLWLGSSFFDILMAPIPRSFFPDKPPVDEGVYIYNLLHGKNIVPGVPFRKLFPVGLPTSTITNMYINFYYAGILIGSIMMGYIIKYFYNLLLLSNYNAQATFLYANVIFGNFAITNLRIVGFSTIAVFLILITLTMRLFIKGNKKYEN